jgi:hypothetical protein
MIREEVLALYACGRAWLKGERPGDGSQARGLLGELA